MIHLVTGADTYKQQAALNTIFIASKLAPEQYDGANMTEGQLIDCLSAGTLFSSERLVVIKGISDNKVLWDKLAAWLDRLSTDTVLVLVEPSPDRRTKAYKQIAKAAKLVAAEPWTERETNVALQWLIGRAKELAVNINSSQAGDMVARATLPAERPGGYVIDQQCLQNALASLSVLDGPITDDNIAAVMPESHADSVFEVLDTALRGDTVRTRQLLANLKATADPYMVFGFIASQWVNLVVLKLTGQDPQALGVATGVSPYLFKKLQRPAGELSDQRLVRLTQLLAELDLKLKTTGLDPWVAVDRFVAEIVKIIGE